MVADLDAVAPTPAHADFLRVVDAAVTARRADGSYPAPELAEIVRATQRRANGRMASSFTRDLQALALAADLDLEPPVGSQIRFASGIKSGVGKVVGFYVRHLGTQVTESGCGSAPPGRDHGDADRAAGRRAGGGAGGAGPPPRRASRPAT